MEDGTINPFLYVHNKLYFYYWSLSTFTITSLNCMYIYLLLLSVNSYFTKFKLTSPIWVFHLIGCYMRYLAVHLKCIITSIFETLISVCHFIFNEASLVYKFVNDIIQIQHCFCKLVVLAQGIIWLFFIPRTL